MPSVSGVPCGSARSIRRGHRVTDETPRAQVGPQHRRLSPPSGCPSGQSRRDNARPNSLSAPLSSTAPRRGSKIARRSRVRTWTRGPSGRFAYVRVSTTHGGTAGRHRRIARGHPGRRRTSDRSRPATVRRAAHRHAAPSYFVSRRTSRPPSNTRRRSGRSSNSPKSLPTKCRAWTRLSRTPPGSGVRRTCRRRNSATNSSNSRFMSKTNAACAMRPARRSRVDQRSAGEGAREISWIHTMPGDGASRLSARRHGHRTRVLQRRAATPANGRTSARGG